MRVGDQDVRVFGLEFFWPMKTANPHYDLVPADTDILVCHGPARGFVDGGKGCAVIQKLVERVNPALVVSGHVHSAHGVTTSTPWWGKATEYVNAANCAAGEGHTIGWSQAIEVSISLSLS